ncbi:hypothetical protein SS50377_23784 [Spironucleus salmonicida]|uniref:Uncharacterized protein n=1 Tax=Spironucleus salmonicida TaxID=348837 RepID=V6LP56_9EUKA|nr:hypothetical protein SS50377_23784 [Spironucleus salmonicida]|eukprot:EST46462.1 Hypothetical protein SS50377_13544 [Spironucleus salmonicida]
MQAQILDRIKTIPLPSAVHASQFSPVKTHQLFLKLQDIKTDALRSKKLIFALDSLQNLTQQSPYAELHAYKALFEVAVKKPQNALETLRSAAKKRAEPTEMLRDFEQLICEKSGEKPQIVIRKARNDPYSSIYRIDQGMADCLEFLCFRKERKVEIESKKLTAKPQSSSVVKRRQLDTNDLPEAVEESFEPRPKYSSQRPRSALQSSQCPESLANPNSKNPLTRKIIQDYEKNFQHRRNCTVHELRVSDELKGIYGKKVVYRKYSDIIYEINTLIRQNKVDEGGEYICQDFKSVFNIEGDVVDYLQ